MRGLEPLPIPPPEAGPPPEADTRESVVTAFNRTFETFSVDPINSTPEGQWRITKIQAAEHKIRLVEGKNTYPLEFKDPYSDESFISYEGIPVEDLTTYLKTKIESGSLTPEQQKQYEEDLAVLSRNSKPLISSPEALSPKWLKARTELEARYISSPDPANPDPRKTGSAEGDWYLAQEHLRRRLELLPPKKISAKEIKAAAAAGGVPEDEVDAKIRKKAGETKPKKRARRVAGTGVTTPAVEESEEEERLGEPESEVERYMGTDGVEVETPPAETDGAPAEPSENTSFPGEISEPTFPPAPAQVSEPEPERPPEEPEHPTTIRDMRYEAFLASGTVQHKKLAELAASQLLAEKTQWVADPRLGWWKRKLEFVKGIPRRMRFHVLEEYYRQKIVAETMRLMFENNTAFLDFSFVRESLGKGFHVKANEATVGQKRIAGQESFADVVEQMKTIKGAGGELLGEKVQQAESPLNRLLVEKVVKPLVVKIRNGETVDEITDVRNVLVTALGDSANLQGLTQQARDQLAVFLGARSNEYGVAANTFATDIKEMAQQIAADARFQGESLDNLDQYMTFNLGNMRWAHDSDYKRKWIDKLITSIQKRKSTGIGLHPATIGGLALTYSVGAALIGRLPATALRYTPIIGSLYSGFYGAFRRWHENKVDRATHQIETGAYGGQIPDNSTKFSHFERKRFDKFQYNTANVKDLLNGTGQYEYVENGNPHTVARQNVELLLGKVQRGEATQEEIHALSRQAAEIEERLDFSIAEKVDLITFEGAEQSQHGRMQLTQRLVEIRLALREVGIDDTKYNLLKEALKQHFVQDKGEQDRKFRRSQITSSTIAGVGMAAVGFGIGKGVQWVAKDVISHATHGAAVEMRPASFAQSLREIAGEKGRVLSRVGNHQTFIPQGTQWIPDRVHPGHFDLVLQIDHSKVLIDNARFGKSGRLVGFDQAHSLLKNTDVRNRPLGHEVLTGHKAVERFNKLGTPAKVEYYGYDTPVSDFNELRFYDGKIGSTVVFDMSKMRMSFQDGLVPRNINVQDVLHHPTPRFRAGFSFNPYGTDRQIFLPVGPDGKLALGPHSHQLFDLGAGRKIRGSELYRMLINQKALSKFPDGNLGTELFSRQEVFNLGRDGHMGLIHAAVRVREADGSTLIKSLATIRGSGTAHAVVTKEFAAHIQIPKNLPHVPTIPHPHQPHEIPVIPIPFWPRFPLEPLQKLERIPLPARSPYYPGYYNFEYRSFTNPDGSPKTLANLIRLGPGLTGRGPSTVPPSIRASTSEATLAAEIKGPTSEGEEALVLIHEAFVRTPHIYIGLSSAIGDAVLSTPYLLGIRQYADLIRDSGTGPAKKITVIVPQNIVPLLAPLRAELDFEIVVAERYKMVEKVNELIQASNETDALALEFDHFEAAPIVDALPGNGLVARDLFSASLGLYNNVNVGQERFTEFLSGLLSIPPGQRIHITPRLVLPENTDEIFVQLHGKYGIDDSKEQIALVIEASNNWKRYSLSQWREVVDRLAKENPNREYNIVFNEAGGTYTRRELEKVFAGVPGVRFVSEPIPEAMIFLSHQNLVISNDTGLAHIAAVVDNGPPVISLHVPDFPPEIWTGNLNRQIGLLPPTDQLQGEFQYDELDESRKWINKIAPETVVNEAIKALRGIRPTPPTPSAGPPVTVTPSPGPAVPASVVEPAEAEIKIPTKPAEAGKRPRPEVKAVSEAILGLMQEVVAAEEEMQLLLEKPRSADGESFKKALRALGDSTRDFGRAVSKLRPKNIKNQVVTGFADEIAALEQKGKLEPADRKRLKLLYRTYKRMTRTDYGDEAEATKRIPGGKRPARQRISSSKRFGKIR